MKKKIKMSTKDYEEMIEYQHKLNEDLIDELDKVYQENLDQAIQINRLDTKMQHFEELKEDLKEARADYINYCATSVPLYGLDEDENYFELGDITRINVKKDNTKHTAMVTGFGKTLFKRIPYMEVTYEHKGKMKTEKIQLPEDQDE